MAKRVPKAYRDVLVEHRRRLDRLSGTRSIAPLRRLYEEAIMLLERRLASLGSSSTTFTSHQYRQFLGQLYQGLALITKTLVGGMSSATRTAQVDALRGLIQDIGKLEQKFTGAEVALPIEEAGLFQGVVSGTRETLMRVNEVSFAKYGARLIRKMEGELSLSLMSGEDLGQTIERVVKAADSQWWEAERIARTELAWAYNVTNQRGMQESQRELPDLMMRWTEHVSDTKSPRGLDGRVDVDSIALHGQVASPSGAFYFPNVLPPGAVLNSEQQKEWPRVRSRFAGQMWPQPPNRPNDRATLSPWRPHWGVPAWRWVNGSRVSV